MAIPVGTVIEIVQRGDLIGQTCLTTYHYAVNIASSTPSGVTELQNFIAQHWNVGPGTISDSFVACLPDNYLLNSTSAQAIFPVRARRVPVDMNHAGLRATAQQANVQGSVTTVTDLAGRQHIGGKRLPITPNDSINGSISPALLVNMNVYANNCTQPLVVAIGGAEYVPVIFHRSPAIVPRFTLISDAFAQTSTRVLRRRTVGLGI